MNVYDCAHQLAKALKTSDELKQYKLQMDSLQKDEPLKQMVVDFRQKQIEFQTAQLSGEDTEQKMQQLQTLYEVLTKNPKAAEFLQAEIRFSQLMNDIYRIIEEAIGIQDAIGIEKNQQE